MSDHKFPFLGAVFYVQGVEFFVIGSEEDCAFSSHGWRAYDPTPRFEFPDFVSALAFTNRVGELAEDEGHHPDIYLSWGKVIITIWTHKINGLTESDFILAAKIGDIYS